MTYNTEIQHVKCVLVTTCLPLHSYE